jgi:hypothetical protein
VALISNPRGQLAGWLEARFPPEKKFKKAPLDFEIKILIMIDVLTSIYL